MNVGKIYQVLDLPFLYSLSQNILAPGANTRISKKIHSLYKKLPEARRLLDVGCGPSSWLFKEDVKPIGLDITPSYIKKYRQSGAMGYIGSSDNLPFGDHSFDGVWSIGLLHHLPKKQAQKSIQEMLRVSKKNGYIVILDAVLPTKPIKRPIAYILRKIDRGGFVRSGRENKELFPNINKWKISRLTYSYTGSELMIFVYKKP